MYPMDVETSDHSATVVQVESSKLLPMIVIMAIITGVSVVANILLYEAYRHEEQTEDLKRYDLDFFKQNDWASLKSQVDTQGELIKSYGLQKAVKDAAKEK